MTGGGEAHRELACSLARVDVLGALEHLHDGFGTLHLEDLAFADPAVGERELDDLSELGKLRTQTIRVSLARDSVRRPESRAAARPTKLADKLVRTLTSSRITSGPFTALTVLYSASARARGPK